MIEQPTHKAVRGYASCDPTEFEEPTAKNPLWRPYVPEGGGAVWGTIAVVEARGLDLLLIEFEVSKTTRCGRVVPFSRSDMLSFFASRERGDAAQQSLPRCLTTSSSRKANGQITMKRCVDAVTVDQMLSWTDILRTCRMARGLNHSISALPSLP